MGLAASQARLLTITARLSDNELRSQTINNAKMRLATQSAQASDEYLSALNKAQMMFSNISADGLTQKQALTFNALTQYSPYNTQYGIINSAGQIMVSEEDAAIFKNNSQNLEGFLKAHGLEWETTFFDDDTLQDKLKSFYSGDNTAYIGNLLAQSYNGKSGSEALKERYFDSLSQEASIENLNYEILARNYYQESIQLYNNTIPEFRSYILGEGENAVTESSVVDAISSSWNNADGIRKEIKSGQTNPGGARKTDGQMGTGPTAAYSFSNISRYLTQAGKDYIDFLIGSLKDEVYPGSGKPTAGYQCDVKTFSGPSDRVLELPIYDNDGNQTGTKTENAKVYHCGHVTIVIGGLVPTGYADEPTNHKPTGYTTGNYIQLDRDDGGGWDYGGTGDLHDKEYKQEIPGAPTDPAALQKFLAEQVSKVKEKQGDGYHSYQVATDANGNPDYSQIAVLNIFDVDRGDAYHAFVTKYFDMILDCEAYFDAEAYAKDHSNIPTLEEYNRAKNLYVAEYGFAPAKYEYLVNFEELIKSGTYGSTDSFNSVLNSWLVDKMLDVLGEPKYAWVDKYDTSNSGNADAKAQWLTNLFNRMQRGYKVLENGLAKSQEWLEYAFESGLVTMEQVDLSYNWVAMDYKTCSNIYEETDNSAAVAKAEAKYNRAMNDIKQKDQMFDLQLKNIDTEHSALQTEYDVVKSVMNKNIERTMKFNQNA